MKNILIVSPNIDHVTSFYRCMGPFAQLRRQYPGRFAFISPQLLTWSTMAMADVVFMHRPFSQDHVKILNMAKQHKVSVWVDYDDDVIDLPQSNPAHKEYSKIEVKEALIRILTNCDVISVSTKQIANKYNGFRLKGHECVVIPNALDESVFKIPTKYPKTQPIVLWRGSDTHNKDLMSFSQEIEMLIEKNQEFAFVFIGKNIDWKFKEMISDFQNVRFIDELDLFGFFRRVQTLAPAIQIVPLWDCDLNRGKSNIAWIESTNAGAVTVGPNFPEWNKPGISTYDSPAQFFEVTQGMINRFGKDLSDQWKQSNDYIASELCLKHTNILRKEILDLL